MAFSVGQGHLNLHCIVTDYRHQVLTTAFQTRLAKRIHLLKKLRAIFSTIIVPLRKKLAILRPLKMFASLSYREVYALAGMMKLKLLPRCVITLDDQ